MAPLQLLLGAVLSLSSAHAEVPVDAPAVVLEIPRPTPSVASFESACPLPNDLMHVLNALEVVGVIRVDRTAKLVSHDGVRDTERLPVREASWAPASEPPRMPFFYARMMQLDF